MDAPHARTHTRTHAQTRTHKHDREGGGRRGEVEGGRCNMSKHHECFCRPLPAQKTNQTALCDRPSNKPSQQNCMVLYIYIYTFQTESHDTPSKWGGVTEQKRGVAECTCAMCVPCTVVVHVNRWRTQRGNVRMERTGLVFGCLK